MTAGGPLDGIAEEVVEQFALGDLDLGRPTRPVGELLRLDGQVALVTGGGGEGLGHAICRRLAEAGAMVGVLDMSLVAAEQTVDVLTRELGATAVAMEADVTDWAQCQAAVAAVTERLGVPDILVNNAGGGFETVGMSLVDIPFERMKFVLDLNLGAVLAMTKAVLPGMVERGSGTVIAVASEAGLFSSAGIVTYSSAKAGVVHFVRALAREVGPSGVRVLSVSPGTIIAERNLERMRGADLEQLAPLAGAMNRTSLGRCSTPDEVATVVSFLASEAGGYVHGTNVSVGGGISG